MAQNQPPKPAPRSSLLLLFVLLILAAVMGWLLWGRRTAPENLVSTNPDLYRRFVSSFTRAAVALHVCDMTHGVEYAREATKVYPEEPAAWVNLAVAYTRSPGGTGGGVPTAEGWKKAADAMERARGLAPNDPRVEMIYGFVEGQQNRVEEALKHYRRAVELDPANVQARYALVFFLDRRDSTPEGRDEVIQNLQEIVKVQPDNLLANVMIARAAAAASKTEIVREAILRLKKYPDLLSGDARNRASEIERALAAGKLDSTLLIFLENVAKPLPAYHRGRAKLAHWDPTGIVDSLPRFIKLPNPTSNPAPADDRLDFTPQPVPNGAETPSSVQELTPVPELTKKEIAGGYHVPLREEGPTATATANATGLTITSGGRNQVIAYAFGDSPSPDSLLFADWSFDFMPDLVLAGMGGLRIYRQEQGGRFVDVTARTGLAPAVVSGKYTGAWQVDIESDGDLDIVLGTKTGPPIVLQNNSDRTFKPIKPFPGISGVTGFVWADLDGDGTPDAAILDSEGKLHIFENQRSANFFEATWSGNLRRLSAPAQIGKCAAIAAADIDRDSRVDLLVLQEDPRISRITRKDSGWDTADLVQWQSTAVDATARILTADLDNNGGIDLIATGSFGTQVWLQQPGGNLLPLAAHIRANHVTTGQPTRQGRIDLLGISPDGNSIRLANMTTKRYHWQIIRPRTYFVAAGPSSAAEQNRKVNTFGIGGSVDVRSGMLYQKLLMTSPQVHLGLGDYTNVDALQFTWPDGSLHGEFDYRPPNAKEGEKARPIPVDIAFSAPKRMKGSCPWLFAWDGKKMAFVADTMWRSPLGLRINSQGTVDVATTMDWLKIRGDQLVPRDGFYDIRITADLWETHFFDHVSLMTVDHPAGTGIFVDERFAIPIPPLKVYATSPPQPVVKAIDDRGRDVTSILRSHDERYLDMGRGEYQGVTRDHWVEVELPPDSTINHQPSTINGSWLLANGWIHPTDTSINVALSQGRHEPPRDLSLEIPDGKRGWKAAKPHLGFPAGKNKTILIDLTGLFPPGAPRRLRLRTNLEIYWDYIGWAEGVAAPIKTRRILPSASDLRFRGFSEVTQASESSPELPEYDRLASTGQPWLDLTGYYTRFGDVRELLTKVDDRYVIMNAGDELVLRFPAQSPPPAGWIRDYVFVTDGWTKDGNFNTGFSKTVLPLPSHADRAYNRPPGRLEDEPVYRRYPRDWQVYHTRYVAPYLALHGLRPNSTH